MIAGLKAQGLSIAVLAVDPSSPLSGGALLGDRLRMIQHSNDPNVFIRSIANRGHLGGLSLSTHEIVDLLQAAGKEIIIIETVGVGPVRSGHRQRRRRGAHGPQPRKRRRDPDLQGRHHRDRRHLRHQQGRPGRQRQQDQRDPQLFRHVEPRPPDLSHFGQGRQGHRRAAGRHPPLPAAGKAAASAKKAPRSRRTTSKRSSPSASRKKCASIPASRPCCRAPATANPFHLADQIVQKLKAGGSHDKKN